MSSRHLGRKRNGGGRFSTAQEEPAVQLRLQAVAACPSPCRTPPVPKKASTATFGSDGDVRLGDLREEQEQLAGDGDGDGDYDGLPETEAEGVPHDAARRGFPFGLRVALLFLLYYGILSVYILIGAVVIRAFELPFEIETRANSDRHTSEFLDFVRNQTAAFWNDSQTAEFEGQLQAYVKGVEHRVRCGFSTEEERWTLINAMFYVGTLVTTIGYGQIAPVTTGGRVFTVLISLIGIPLLMLNVAHLGIVLSHFIEVFMTFLRRKFNLTLLSDSEAKSPQRYHIPLSVAFLVIMIYVLAMAGIIAATEEWPFVDAVYFTFITLATVGLGDLVPDHPLLLLVFSVFIVVGLTLVTIFIELSEFHLERRLVALRKLARELVNKASAIFTREMKMPRHETLQETRASASSSTTTAVTSPC